MCKGFQDFDLFLVVIFLTNNVIHVPDLPKLALRQIITTFMLDLVI